MINVSAQAFEQEQAAGEQQADETGIPPVGLRGNDREADPRDEALEVVHGAHPPILHY
jgi:hypothetical protein